MKPRIVSILLIALALCLAVVSVPLPGAYGSPEELLDPNDADNLFEQTDPTAPEEQADEGTPNAEISPVEIESPASPGGSADPSDPSGPSNPSALATMEGQANTLGAYALEPYEIEISTYSEFIDVWTNPKYNNISIVYLKNNLLYGTGDYSSNPGHVDITIVGHPKADSSVRYAIRDRSGTYIRPKSNNHHITLKDMDIYGYSYYGTINFDGRQNGTYEFVNVTYFGCQAAIIAAGKVILRDSEIRIDTLPANTLGPNSGSQDERQEAFELGGIEFYGNCSIKKQAGPFSNLAIRNHAGRNVIVHEGANVYLEKTAQATGYGVFFIDSAGNNTPNIDIGKNATLSINCRRMLPDTGHQFNNITIRENASLLVDQYANTADLPMFSLRGNIMVGENAVLDLRRPANNNYYSQGLIFGEPTGNHQLIVQNPKRVLLYDPGTGLLTTSGNWHFAVSGSVEAINTWTNADVADTITTAPSQAWNKQDGGALELYAEVTGQQTTQASIANLANGDFSSASFNTASFDLNSIRLLSMGSYTLTIDEVSAQSTVLSGSADALSALNFSYVSAGNAQNYNGVASAGGSYIVTIPDAPIDEEAVITIKAYSNYLHYQHRTQVTGVYIPQNLSLNVPQEIDFGLIQQPTWPQYFYRVGDPFSIVITDSRKVHTPWQLEASLSEPLSAYDGTTTYHLPNALIYWGPNYMIGTLSDVPLSVHSGTTDASGQTTITWGISSGVLLEILPGEAKSDLPYNATIQWTLSTVP